MAKSLDDLTGKKSGKAKERGPMFLPDHARIVAGKPHGGDEEDECPGPVDCREWTPDLADRTHWQQVCYVNPWDSKQTVTCWVHREFLRRAGQRRYQTEVRPTQQMNPARASADVVRQFKD